MNGIMETNNRFTSMSQLSVPLLQALAEGLFTLELLAPQFI